MNTKSQEKSEEGKPAPEPTGTGTRAWWFSLGDGKLRFEDGREALPGVTHEMLWKGKSVPASGRSSRPEACDRGMHASVDILDAARYAPFQSREVGQRLWRVIVDGDISADSDKIAGRLRTYLWGLPVESTDRVLRAFAIECGRSALARRRALGRTIPVEADQVLDLAERVMRGEVSPDELEPARAQLRDARVRLDEVRTGLWSEYRRIWTEVYEREYQRRGAAGTDAAADDADAAVAADADDAAAVAAAAAAAAADAADDADAADAADDAAAADAAAAAADDADADAVAAAAAAAAAADADADADAGHLYGAAWEQAQKQVRAERSQQLQQLVEAEARRLGLIG